MTARRARRFLAPGFAAAALVLAASCAKKAPPRGIRVAVHSDPLSLDPHEFNEVLTFSLLANVYEGLTGFNKEIGLVPALAESWENPDERTWLFRLRPGARFHDGRPVEAADVVFTVERARTNPRSQLSSYLVQVESVRALGPHTVEIRTKRPCAVLLNKLASIFVVPRDSPFPVTQPIGSGPFRVASFEKGRRLLLTKFEKHRDAASASAIPSLEFLTVPDAAKRTNLLLSGEVDIAQDPDPKKLAELKAAACCRVALRPAATVEFLHMKVGDPRFRDRRVREAIDLAVDRRLLIERSLDGLGQPASQLVPPGVFGFDPSLKATERDLVKAKRLLAEAGVPNGFAVTLVHRLGRRGEELARQLGEAGIRAIDSGESYAEVSEKLKRVAVPFYFGGVVAVTADASDVLDSFVHTRTAGYGQTNANGYSNPTLDALIEESGARLEQAGRRTLLQRCLRMAAEDLWILPLDIPYDTYGVKKDVVFEPRLDRRLLGSEMGWKKSD